MADMMSAVLEIVRVSPSHAVREKKLSSIIQEMVANSYKISDAECDDLCQYCCWTLMALREMQRRDVQRYKVPSPEWKDLSDFCSDLEMAILEIYRMNQPWII